MVPRLTPVSCQQLVRFFESRGYRKDRQRGSHLAMVKPGTARPVVIPMHSEVSTGVILSNLRTAGVSRDEFLAWLGKQ
jgi:predicted RNA binding protein YcfA (HicA-like mRNA interferase family)